MPYVLIDPQDKLSYTFDWSSFLDDAGSPSDTVSSAIWTVTPQTTDSPTEPVLSTDTTTVTTTTVCISNCIAGQIYTLACKMTTGLGQVHEQTVTLRCEQR